VGVSRRLARPQVVVRAAGAAGLVQAGEDTAAVGAKAEADLRDDIE